MLSRLLAVTLALSILGFSQKSKQPKTPDLEIVEARAERTPEGIVIEGKLKNPSVRTWQGVHLLVDLLGASSNLLVTRRGPIENDDLGPEGESEFRLQMPDAPKAARIRLNAEDSTGRDLVVANNGPFSID